MSNHWRIWLLMQVINANCWILSYSVHILLIIHNYIKPLNIFLSLHRWKIKMGPPIFHWASKKLDLDLVTFPYNGTLGPPCFFTDPCRALLFIVNEMIQSSNNPYAWIKTNVVPCGVPLSTKRHVSVLKCVHDWIE